MSTINQELFNDEHMTKVMALMPEPDRAKITELMTSIDGVALESWIKHGKYGFGKGFDDLDFESQSSVDERLEDDSPRFSTPSGKNVSLKEVFDAITKMDYVLSNIEDNEVLAKDLVRLCTEKGWI